MTNWKLPLVFVFLAYFSSLSLRANDQVQLRYSSLYWSTQSCYGPYCPPETPYHTFYVQVKAPLAPVSQEVNIVYESVEGWVSAPLKFDRKYGTQHEIWSGHLRLDQAENSRPFHFAVQYKKGEEEYWDKGPNPFDEENYFVGVSRDIQILLPKDGIFLLKPYGKLKRTTFLPQNTPIFVEPNFGGELASREGILSVVYSQDGWKSQKEIVLNSSRIDRTKFTDLQILDEIDGPVSYYIKSDRDGFIKVDDNAGLNYTTPGPGFRLHQFKLETEEGNQSYEPIASTFDQANRGTFFRFAFTINEANQKLKLTAGYDLSQSFDSFLQNFHPLKYLRSNFGASQRDGQVKFGGEPWMIEEPGDYEMILWAATEQNDSFNLDLNYVLRKKTAQPAIFWTPGVKPLKELSGGKVSLSLPQARPFGLIGLTQDNKLTHYQGDTSCCLPKIEGTASQAISGITFFHSRDFDSRYSQSPMEFTFDLNTRDYSLSVGPLPSMYFRGTPHGFQPIPMTRNDAGVWEITVPVTGIGQEAFKFDLLGDWITNFGGSDIDGSVALGSADIPLDHGPGQYRIAFNDLTMTYNIERIADLSADWQRTIVLIKHEAEDDDRLYLLGGIDWGQAKKVLGRDCGASEEAKWDCSLPIRHNIGNEQIEFSNDLRLDWYGAEQGQGDVLGSPMVWTTDQEDFAQSVLQDGIGYSPLNRWGADFWLLDVEMDCNHSVNGWFELRSILRDGGIETMWLRDPNRLWGSSNHFAKCGQVNVFERGRNQPIFIGAIGDTQP